MGQPLYRYCRYCGRHSGEVGTLSWSRQCTECGLIHFYANMEGMLTMTGHYASHWRRRMAASVGAVLVDEPRTTS